MRYRDLIQKRIYSRENIIPSLKQNGFYDKAEKINSCSLWGETAVCEQCYTTHFVGSYSCHDRLCPICAKKRTMAWCIKLVPVLSELLERGYHLNMLTFTIRTNNQMTFKEAIDLLYSSWRYMTHDYKQSAKKFNELILGGVRSLEVKMGTQKLPDGTEIETGNPHPHFHVLVCTHGTVPYKYLQNTLFEMWNHAIKNVLHTTVEQSLGTLHVASIKCSQKSSILGEILEVFKYITKLNWQSDYIKDVINALENVRGLNTFGNLRYFLQDKEIEKLMDKSLEELQNHVCVVCGGTSFYHVDQYLANNAMIYDFDKRSEYEYLSALSTFNEID